MRPRSLFSLADYLERLSQGGDPLEVSASTMEFERFPSLLTRDLDYSDGANSGRPPFALVVIFKLLVVQEQHSQLDVRMEFTARDHLSSMRFLDFDLGGAISGEDAIRHYRNRVIESHSLETLSICPVRAAC